jgi:hypothetical protein
VKNFLDDQAAAELLGRTTATLRRWRRLNIGPAYIRFGGTILYDLADIESWLLSLRHDPSEHDRSEAPRI